ncbi:hypothetical protein PMLGA01_120031400, partial [Plasmodium malariae]
MNSIDTICGNERKDRIYNEKKGNGLNGKNKKNSEQAREKNAAQSFAHTCKKKGKQEKTVNYYLPTILNIWCKRTKYAISIYNSNKKKYKIKKYLLHHKNTDRGYLKKENLFCEENSRYSVNECVNTLIRTIFNSKNCYSFKSIFFLSKEKYVYSFDRELKYARKGKYNDLVRSTYREGSNTHDYDHDRGYDNGKDNVGDSVGDSDDHSSDLSIDEDFLSEDI